MFLWPVEHFFEHICHHFWVGATMQQQTHPKVMTNILKKCLTVQRFIFSKVTSYKIHTLKISIVFALYVVSALKSWLFNINVRNG